jgi:putative transposase
MRKFQFQTNAFYHIYNRGVDKREIYCHKNDFIKFIYKINDHNNIYCADDKFFRTLSGHSVSANTECPKKSQNKLVDIICYSLLPNHYHFILKQLIENGISKFLHKLEMGYAKFFNKKYKRTGALFEGQFKAIHINTDEYLLYLSAYINSNAEIHKIAKAENWPWSSCSDYFNKRNGKLCNKNIILKDYQDINDYKEIVNEVIYGSILRKKEIKMMFLEEN